MIVSPSLGYRQGLFAKRTAPPVAIIIHYPGPGPERRWRDAGMLPGTSVFTSAVHLYTYIMKPAPHRVLGGLGEHALVTPDEYCAWHTGTNAERPNTWPKDEVFIVDAANYASKAWKKSNIHWWTEKWPDLASPLDLADGKLWHSHTCNGNTLGVEVTEFTPGALKELRQLCLDWCAKYQIPFTNEHVLCHHDAHPMARTVWNKERALPYDPTPKMFQFSMIS